MLPTVLRYENWGWDKYSSEWCAETPGSWDLADDWALHSGRLLDHFTIVPVRLQRVLLKKSEMALTGKAALLGGALSS
jgi:hypothetical protein